MSVSSFAIHFGLQINLGIDVRFKPMPAVQRLIPAIARRGQASTIAQATVPPAVSKLC
jgi:hypothetical protein